ncbi:hypothetical protein J8F10_06650 [Gemmata sp. G18]|uniref:Uncharacterized protein n=1 Tax=Gemmata palustris TaxID=2822762 RepID=A0ABS5BMR3_9BACT|nr:hypothetical protein [Gemmata palustris]MBP3954960.1 hypothetical protein [Gemmata palustris]
MGQVVSGGEPANQASVFDLVQDAAGMLSATSECGAQLLSTDMEFASCYLTGQVPQDRDCELEQALGQAISGRQSHGLCEGTRGFRLVRFSFFNPKGMGRGSVLFRG